MIKHKLMIGVSAASLMAVTGDIPSSPSSPSSPGGGGGLEPSYFNHQARGNRDGYVTFSTTAAFGGTTGLTALIYGHENSDNANNSYFSSQTVTGKYLRIDFGLGNKKRMTEFTWKQDIISSAGTWTLQGSNDASAWTDIQTGIALGSSATQVVSFTNASYYRYYQLIGTAGSTSTAAWLMGWWWKIADETETTSPNYENFYSFGLLTNAGCTLSATQPFTGGNETYLFDSFTSNATAYFATNNATNGYIQVQFPESVVISGFKWLQSNSATHGTWSVQGSNNGTDWTDITTGLTLGGATSQEYTFTASSAYTYLRLQKTAGLTSSSPYLYGVLFKIIRSANVA